LSWSDVEELPEIDEYRRDAGDDGGGLLVRKIKETEDVRGCARATGSRIDGEGAAGSPEFFGIDDSPRWSRRTPANKFTSLAAIECRDWRENGEAGEGDL
jgi:hypothetical protein